MSRHHTSADCRRIRSTTRTGRFARPVCLVLGVLALAGNLTAQQAPQSEYPIYTPEQFVSTMKAAGQNFAGVNQAITAGDFESAKSRAIRVREQLATTVTFWRKNKKDDGVKMLHNSTTKLDELDAVLSKTPVDKDAAVTAFKAAAGTCQACHAVYREQDPATKAYKFKL